MATLWDDSLWCTSKVFRPWAVDAVWLLRPSVREFVPAGDPAHLVRDLVAEELDITAILPTYTELRGCPPHHPAMMAGLLLVNRRCSVTPGMCIRSIGY
jgi:transposase